MTYTHTIDLFFKLLAVRTNYIKKDMLLVGTMVRICSVNITGHLMSTLRWRYLGTLHKFEQSHVTISATRQKHRV